MVCDLDNEHVISVGGGLFQGGQEVALFENYFKISCWGYYKEMGRCWRVYDHLIN